MGCQCVFVCKLGRVRGGGGVSAVLRICFHMIIGDL